MVSVYVNFNAYFKLKILKYFFIENNGIDFIVKKNEHLFETKMHSDVMFNVKGKEIEAHKGILTSGSDVFETMFNIDMEEKKKNQVEITDIEYNVFEQLLRYLYCGKVNDIELVADDLIVAAEKYGIKSLKLECEKQLIKKISIENCLYYFNFSDLIGTKELERNAIEFINGNFQLLKNSISDLPKNLVVKLLQHSISRPSFNSNPELDASKFYSETNYRVPAVWVNSSNGSVPSNAVVGGSDVNGEPLYVGRAIQSDNVLPGKVVCSHGVCYVGHAGHEHAHREYQVLTNPSGSNLIWINATRGNVPLGALQAGRQNDGEALYVGRAWHSGSLVTGKVHPSHGVLYASFGGDDLPFIDYEILVCKDVQL